MKKLICLLAMVIIVFCTSLLVNGIDINDTKLLSQPAISDSHIAFVYAGDLWIADTNGSNVHRLTSDDGIESDPVFSPDGKLIAFSAQYDGNTDVFVVSSEGGVPKRLTWHPGADIVRGFTPDGSSVLFISSRFVFTRRYNQLFTVSIKGGFPESLKIPNAYKATYSPDGKRLAYTPLGGRFHQWKHYRGGTVTTIWLYTFADHSVVKIPQPDGRCNDTDPMWTGDKVYFRSDRNGEFNLFSYDINSKKIEQLTQYSDFPILNATAYKDKIIYEQAAHIHILNLQDLQSEKLTVGVATDLLEVRPRYVEGSRYIRNSSISPTGARAVFEFRGEIITVPAEKGDPRNITNTAGVHERSPVWSPDGKLIAYFSEESGEYELYVSKQDGKGETRKFELSGSGFYASPVWSPDNKKLTFTDNARNLYWIDLGSGTINNIASESLYAPGAFGTIQGVWSHDSKWIVYTTNTEAYIQKVYVYSIENKESYPITDGLSEVSDPVFDKSGKYLYFFASTDAGPVKHWFAMSNSDMRMSKAIYLVTLQEDIPSPLAKESDEEEVKEAELEKNGNGNKGEKEKQEKKKPLSIDFDGINQRIIALPVSSGNYFDLQVGEEGQVYYLKAPATARGPNANGTELHKYDLKNRKDEVILSEVNRC